MRKILILVIILGLFFSLFPINIISGIDGEIIFEDDFTGSLKPEWVTAIGTWEHNLTLNAIQTHRNDKNEIIVNITTPDNTLTEMKVIKVSPTAYYFDIFARHTITSGGINSGYSVGYIEVYSRLYDIAFFLIRWDNGSRTGELDSCLWSELGLSNISDVEGKILSISVEDDIIKGYLDDVEILSATDDVYSSGQSGILGNPETGVLIFDNFKITEIVEAINPPNKPICIHPVDKTTHVNIDTTLKSKVIDIDNNTMNVSFYFDDIFLEKISNVANNTIVESSNLSLDYSRIYTWYVVVEDEFNLTTSDIFIFATTCEPEPEIPNIPPEKPILTFPDNNSINTSKIIKFLAYVDDIDDDFVYVSFYWEDNSEIQSLFTITNYTVRTDSLELEYNTTYSWYVIVTDFIDFNISDIYTFTTEIEVIEDDDDIIPPVTEHDYSILFIGICLAVFVFILEFLSHKLKIKKTKLLSIIELFLILIIISIMIFLRLT